MAAHQVARCFLAALVIVLVESDASPLPTSYVFRNTSLRAPMASVTFCLDRPASEPCPWPEGAGRQHLPPLCNISEGLKNGRIAIQTALHAQALTVVVVPEEDETIWYDHVEGGAYFGGLVGEMLSRLATEAGFEMHVLVVRPPASTDLYGGDWDLWLTDWANRVDLVAAWFYDTPQRRAMGISYPYNFYVLDSTFLIVDRGQRTRLSWFAFLSPFSFSLWACILAFALLTGIITRLAEGKLHDPFAQRRRAHATGKLSECLHSARMSSTARASVVGHSTISYTLGWHTEAPVASDVDSANQRQVSIGVLSVSVHGADALPGLHQHGAQFTSDPYIELHLGDLVVFTSPPKLRTLHPRWARQEYESEALRLQDAITSGLTLVVRDYAVFGEAKVLGECAAPLDELVWHQSLRFDAAPLRTPAVETRAAHSLQASGLGFSMPEAAGVIDPDAYLDRVYEIVRRKHYLWLAAMESLQGWYAAVIAFFEGSGMDAMTEPKTLGGKLVALGWGLACMLFLAAYTAELAQQLLQGSRALVVLSATGSFAEAAARGQSICVRPGTADYSMLSTLAGPQQFQRVAKHVEGGIFDAARVAANEMRTLGCDGTVMPLWFAEDALVSSINQPCDLRLHLPTITSQRGGWPMRSPWMPPPHANYTGAAKAPVHPDACMNVLVDIVAHFLGIIAPRDLDGLRVEQRERQRGSTCTEAGTPGQSIEDSDADAEVIDVRHFSGLFVILLACFIVAIVTSAFGRRRATHALRSAKGLSHYAALAAHAKLDEASSSTRKLPFHTTSSRLLKLLRHPRAPSGAPSGAPRGAPMSGSPSLSHEEKDAAAQQKRIARKRVLAELLRAPLTTQEWRDGIDHRLVQMEVSFETQGRLFTAGLERLEAKLDHPRTAAQAPGPADETRLRQMEVSLETQRQLLAAGLERLEAKLETTRTHTSGGGSAEAPPEVYYEL